MLAFFDVRFVKIAKCWEQNLRIVFLIKWQILRLQSYYLDFVFKHQENHSKCIDKIFCKCYIFFQRITYNFTIIYIYSLQSIGCYTFKRVNSSEKSKEGVFFGKISSSYKIRLWIY